MQYVALLRGINVGGNNIIKMIDLKHAFERAGFTDVVTYIQSGNVIFSSKKKDITLLTEEIERLLTKTFSYQARAVLQTRQEFQTTVTNVPKEWTTRDDLRCYVAFTHELYTQEEIVAEVTPKEGVDTIQTGHRVIYLTTTLEGLTKSSFVKLMGKRIYKDMTIRNYTTVKKILELMSQTADA